MTKSDQHLLDVLEFTARRLDQLDEALVEARSAIARLRDAAQIDEIRRAREARISGRSPLTEALARAGALSGIPPQMYSTTDPSPAGVRAGRQYEEQRLRDHLFTGEPLASIDDDYDGVRRESQQEAGYGS